MKVRRSNGRVLRQKPVAPKGPWREPDSSELSLLATYQQQIADLEGTVTNLRQRLMDLNASISESIKVQAHLNDLFQNAPVGYIIHDEVGAISGINNTARLMLGLANGAGP